MHFLRTTVYISLFFLNLHVTGNRTVCSGVLFQDKFHAATRRIYGARCIAPVYFPNFAGDHFAYTGVMNDDQADLNTNTKLDRTPLEPANGHVQVYLQGITTQYTLCPQKTSTLFFK